MAKPLNVHLRVARPVSDLHRAAVMYQQGLGLEEIGHFEDHQGFDGVMLGHRKLDYHFEFTCCPTHPVVPTPTAEDLLVFYFPDEKAWRERCAQMDAAGFVEVQPLNPYWAERGRTFADPDGYRIVMEQASWPNGD